MCVDYECKKCGHIQLIFKDYQKPWPDVVGCENCGEDMRRVFSNPIISISKGFDGVIYNPASLTPTNKIKGVAGVTPGVEVDYDGG